MLHSPYGQSIASLCSESRLKCANIHVSEHFTTAVKKLRSYFLNGLTIERDGLTQTFNVLPIMLVICWCFVKEVIGKCSSISLYGKRHISDFG